MLGEYNLFGFVCFPLHLVSEICQIFQVLYPFASTTIGFGIFLLIYHSKTLVLQSVNQNFISNI